VLEDLRKESPLKLEHKPGCIWSDDEKSRKEGLFHRVPIDCCTVEDLLQEIKDLKAEGEKKDEKLKKMALEIYDLETEESY
jgi:hypothetical protein